MDVTLPFADWLEVEWLADVDWLQEGRLLVVDETVRNQSRDCLLIRHKFKVIIKRRNNSNFYRCLRLRLSTLRPLSCWSREVWEGFDLRQATELRQTNALLGSPCLCFTFDGLRQAGRWRCARVIRRRGNALRCNRLRRHFRIDNRFYEQDSEDFWWNNSFKRGRTCRLLGRVLVESAEFVVARHDGANLQPGGPALGRVADDLRFVDSKQRGRRRSRKSVEERGGGGGGCERTWTHKVYSWQNETKTKFLTNQLTFAE